jgi:sugar phosphate isomerase/epimerase
MRFGVKASFKDAHIMAGLDVDLLEVHMDLEDLPRHRRAMVESFRAVKQEHGHDLVVHAPEFMMTGSGPALVDPSSADGNMLSLSMTALEATVSLTQELEGGLIVMHPGGIMPDVEVHGSAGGLDRLITSLDRLRDMTRDAGVLLTVENMPWFYHHKPLGGGNVQRWESSILVDPDDMTVLAPHVDGMTLDVSHAYLYSPKGGMEVIDGFITKHLDRVSHLHLSDALPPDHEGLQVGEGSVDMVSVLRAFHGRSVTAVPEIMGGHMGGGLSFKRALAELRRIQSGLG